MKKFIKVIPMFIVGSLLILANLQNPNRGFHLCSNGNGAQCMGYNIAVFFAYFLGVYLIYIGIKIFRTTNESIISKYVFLRYFIAAIFFIAICLVIFFIMYPIILVKREEIKPLNIQQKYPASHQKDTSLSILKKMASPLEVETLQPEEPQPTFQGLIGWIEKNPNNPQAQKALSMIQSGELTSNNFDDFAQKKQQQLQNFNHTPSEKALTVATNMYNAISELNDKKALQIFYNKYSSGEKNLILAVKNFAVYLDANPDELIILQNLLNKNSNNN